MTTNRKNFRLSEEASEKLEHLAEALGASETSLVERAITALWEKWQGDERAKKMKGKTLLPRTGQPPLSFAGVLITSASSRWVSGREQNRWHEVAIYELPGGGYVLGIGYRTLWQGEEGRDIAFGMDSKEELSSFLQEDFFPEESMGEPPLRGRERWEESCEKLRRGWESILSEVYEGLGIVEDVR